MLKLYITESAYMLEDIDAVKKYYPNIDDNTFMNLITLDPTYRDGSNSVGKYGKWILNLYNKGNLSNEDMNSITDVLNQFTTYRNRIQNKDLNSYKSLSTLEDVLATVVDDDSMLTDRQKLRFLKNVKAGKVSTSAENDYDTVLDTPNFIVYVPNTHEASMKLGKGTEWCTAHENPKWFDKYTNDGKLYIIKNKKTGERWQYSNSYSEFLNQYDEDFNIAELMRQDEKLSKFFEKFLGVDYYSFDGTWIYDGTDFPENMRNAITHIIVSDNVTRLKNDVFDYCFNLISVELPNTVTVIGTRAFSHCTSLTSINIPNSVTDIYAYAFRNCTNLTAINIPNSVTEIGPYAFYSCNNLTVYTNNDYVIDYCEENNIPTKPLTPTESYKLHIKEGNYV